jgi:hypothetical protein
MKKIISLLLFVPFFVKAQYVPLNNYYIGEPQKNFTTHPDGSKFEKSKDPDNYGFYRDKYSYSHPDGTWFKVVFVDSIAHMFIFIAPPEKINALILFYSNGEELFHTPGYDGESDLNSDYFITVPCPTHQGWYTLRYMNSKYSPDIANGNKANGDNTNNSTQSVFGFGETEQQLRERYSHYNIDTSHLYGVYNIHFACDSSFGILYFEFNSNGLCNKRICKPFTKDYLNKFIQFFNSNAMFKVIVPNTQWKYYEDHEYTKLIATIKISYGYIVVSSAP